MPARWAQTTRIRLLGCTAYVRFPGYEGDVWKRQYEELRGRAKNLQPVFERFGRYMVEGSIQRNFEAEGRPERWAPLKPAYAAWKARHYPGRKILELTGAMRRGWEWQATAQTLKIWNTRFYWKFHQKGVPGRNLPRRAMLVMQRADKGVLTRWTREYLRGEWT